jgi:hypothetical protein
MNKPKIIGTRAETAVVRFMRSAGFPQAERRALRGTLDAGDVTGCPGVCWSVKGGGQATGASDGLVEKWLDELDVQRQNAGAQVEVLVLQRRGIGEANAGRWWAVMPGVQYETLCSLQDCGMTGCAGHGTVGFGASDPVRIHLAHACRLLVYAGYGTAPAELVTEGALL